MSKYDVVYWYYNEPDGCWELKEAIISAKCRDDACFHIKAILPVGSMFKIESIIEPGWELDI